MKLKIFFSLLFAAAISTSSFAAETNIDWSHYDFNLPSKDSPEVQWWRDSRTNLDQRLAWWRDARFGMFIHWGAYSGLGNEYKGRKGGGYAEHIQRVLKIPIVEYREEVVGKFDPTNFNADEWVRLARDAGMKYIVITSKHHDGFAMWPSKVNSYNIIDATPWHHDPMADLKRACQKYGLKFGFYYSQAFDWGNSNAPGNDWDVKNPGGDTKIGGNNWWETMPEFMASARKYVDTKAIPQLQELIRLYHPDILWFDTAGKLPPSENLRIMRAVREADPNVVISGRLVHGWGDYDDTTDRPANFTPHDGDWEAIPTTNESYGWNPLDTSQKPPSHFIQLLAKASARGGNVLMNIGPRGDGTIDPRDVAILKGIADWWKLNGDSIRGTQRTPLPVQTWGESTINTGIVLHLDFQTNGQTISMVPSNSTFKTLYLHVFDWPQNERLVVGGLKSDVQRAYLQASKKDPVVYSADGMPRDKTPSLSVRRLGGLDMSIKIPNKAPNSADSVVVLECGGDIQADTNRLLQPSFPSDTLRAFDGELHGGLRFGPGKKTDDVAMDWTKTNQFVTWAVRLSEPATYDVFINYDTTNSVTNTFIVSFGSQTLEGTTQKNNNKSLLVGKVSLKPGTFEIKVAPKELKSGEMFKLRNLELRLVAN